MDRLLAFVLVAALLVAAVPATAALADTTDGADETQPGASFAGVVGVQRAEVGNEVAQRSLDRRLAAATSNASKAAVVAEETVRLDERLADLERKKRRLTRAFENGSIDRGRYRAQMAQLAAEIRAVERRANRTAEAANDLPKTALDEQGVEVSRVRSVAQRANRTGGGTVAEAASSVSGRVGNGLGDSPGNADARGNGADRGRAGERGRTGGTDPGTEGSDAPGNSKRRGNASDPGNGNDPGNSAGDDRSSRDGNGAEAGDGAPGGSNVTDDGTDCPGNGRCPGDDAGRGDDGDRGNDGGNGDEGEAGQGNDGAGDAGRGNDADGENRGDDDTPTETDRGSRADAAATTRHLAGG